VTSLTAPGSIQPY